MKVLIVGAGAVGQVYGRHLAAAGAEVCFYVKPKYRAELESGVSMHRHKLLCKPELVRFEDYTVVSSDAEVAATTFDQVWLCISATALRSGWLDPFLAACGDAVIVNFTPGLEDRAYLLARLPEERVVSGMIPFISYQAPLPGESLAEGVAFLLPPGSPIALSGPEAAARAAAEALSKGGCPARVVPNVPATTSMASAVMMPHIAALEIAGWSFAELRRGSLLAETAEAAAEFLAIAAAYHGVEPPGSLKALRPWVMKAGLSLAPHLMPFDLEVYLRYHFTKVGDQTRAMLARNIEIGRGRGLGVAALERLLERLP